MKITEKDPNAFSEEFRFSKNNIILGPKDQNLYFFFKSFFGGRHGVFTQAISKFHNEGDFTEAKHRP